MKKNKSCEPPHKVLLIILDGFGIGKKYSGNAYEKAKKLFFEQIFRTYPWTLLKASGKAVGVPQGTQGGSEIGHFTIGSGRVTLQTLQQIDQDIKNGRFFRNKILKTAFAKAKRKGAIHLLGMISDQGVHSDQRHLYALLKLAKKYRISKVYIHAITDGRDVPERSATKYVNKIMSAIKKIGCGEIASIIGRYFAMDRDQNWKRTEKAYNLYVNAEGARATDPLTAIKNAYARGADTDYYIKPISLNSQAKIKNGDVVIFWNFRSDRTRQLTYAFTREQKIGFKPLKKVLPYLICFGPYSDKAPVVYPTPIIKDNLGAVLDKNHIRQLRIAETEKFAHVTYFFNSQINKPYSTETRVLIDSPKCPSYAQKPEMSAHGITAALIPLLKTGKYPFIALNFANCDLVGHSGEFEASVKAVETINDCLLKIIPTALENNYIAMVTSDHGNVEYMIYEEDGEPCPSHTTNPVPFILISKEKLKLKKTDHKKAIGQLADIAPTILKVLGLQQPYSMTGRDLLA